MGFFSSICQGCGHPLLCAEATNPTNGWMSQSVAVRATGDLYVGEYDGFGRIGSAEYALDEATVWHAACWEVAGCPRDFRGRSSDAPDQGWFFGAGDHDLADPRPSSAPT